MEGLVHVVMYSIKLTKYLVNSSVDVSSFTEYLNVYKLCVEINTGLPASAVAKHFVGLVFTFLYSRLRLSELGWQSSD